MKKEIFISFLLCCVLTTTCYVVEGALEENETYGIEYNEGYGYYAWKNPEQPNWYDPLVKLIIRILTLFTTDETTTITHNVTKESWDGDSYEPTGDESTFSWDITHDKEKEEVTVATIDPVKEFFRDDTDRIDDFNIDSDHPDVLNVSTTIDISRLGLDSEDYGYTTISTENLEEIRKEITEQGFGFDIDSVGGEGGSGSLSRQVGMGDMSDAGKATKGAFGYMFYAFIPMLFIMLWLKFVIKVS